MGWGANMVARAASETGDVVKEPVETGAIETGAATDFTEDELQRYTRHIILPEVGPAGQRALRAASVLVIGAGGLGSGCLPYLAAAGVGQIVLVDDDVVDLSNLQRQVLHATGDIGRSKVESAMEKLSALNPQMAIRPVDGRLTAQNAAALLAGINVVIDGSDNFDTRYVLADAAYAARVPLVSAAMLRFEAQLSTFKGYLGPPHPCYRCLYPTPPPPGTVATCAAAGVFGALAGTIGAWQAMEALKEIIGIGDSLSGRLLVMDALAADVHTIRIPRNPSCACCGLAA